MHASIALVIVGLGHVVVLFLLADAVSHINRALNRQADAFTRIATALERIANK